MSSSTISICMFINYRDKYQQGKTVAKMGNKTWYLLACYTATQGERGHYFLVSNFLCPTGMRTLENQLIKTKVDLYKPNPILMKLKREKNVFILFI